MNNKPGTGQPDNTQRPVIHIGGKQYTLAEANKLAVNEYMRGNIQASADIFQQILAKCPDYADGYNNCGNVLQALGHYTDALVYYDRAIHLKKAYVEAYNNRGNVLQVMKRYPEALASYDQAIAHNPDYAEAYNNRGNTLQMMRSYGEALLNYDKAIAVKPDYAEAYNNRATVLLQMSRFEDALVSCNHAVMLRPDFAQAHNNCGNTLQEMRQYNEALKSYDRAIALQPDYAEAYNNRGNCLLCKGRMPEAEAMFRKALALKPHVLTPLYSLAKMRKYNDASHADIKNIKRLLDEPATSAQGKQDLYFALGKIYDDCGCYDEAFGCYMQANRIGNKAVAYNPDKAYALTSSLIEVFNKDLLAQPFTISSTSKMPLFIVGMPRSGTTLMASILSNHSLVGTAGELSMIIDFSARLQALSGSTVAYPYAVKDMTPAIASQLITDYEARLQRDMQKEVRHVIDKHPLNFKHLGLIAMLFPNAKVIHCTRNPLDTALSNFFQPFSQAYDYAFDIRNIGHFYGEYERTMAHWQSVLPLEMMEISYEDVITHTEGAVRNILDFLDLPWDERCLAPHTNPCTVETASQWQVRQPIYRQSVERWRHYEKHLAPLKEMLQLH